MGKGISTIHSALLPTSSVFDGAETATEVEVPFVKLLTATVAVVEPFPGGVIVTDTKSPGLIDTPVIVTGFPGTHSHHRLMPCLSVLPVPVTVCWIPACSRSLTPAPACPSRPIQLAIS